MVWDRERQGSLFIDFLNGSHNMLWLLKVKEREEVWNTHMVLYYLIVMGIVQKLVQRVKKDIGRHGSVMVREPWLHAPCSLIEMLFRP